MTPHGATPQSSQIIWLENRVAELTKERDDYRAGYYDQKTIREQFQRELNECEDKLAAMTNENEVLIGKNLDWLNCWNDQYKQLAAMTQERDTWIRRADKTWNEKFFLDQLAAAQAQVVSIVKANHEIQAVNAKLREALGDMLTEFRGYDLPYGSAAYTKGNHLINLPNDDTALQQALAAERERIAARFDNSPERHIAAAIRSMK